MQPFQGGNTVLSFSVTTQYKMYGGRIVGVIAPLLSQQWRESQRGGTDAVLHIPPLIPTETLWLHLTEQKLLGHELIMCRNEILFCGHDSLNAWE